MIDFPQDFFKEEYRDGYLVSEMMKRTWAAQMKMLDALQTFYAEHELTYYAEVGTLLGAARHKGYIPWDDDIDIAMPRKDYMKFLALENELPDDLEIRSFYNTESFSSYHAVVAHKAEKLEWNEERMKDNMECPFIIFIDVFPLDFMPGDPEKFKIQKQLYYFSYKMAFDCLTIEENLFSGKLIKIGELNGLVDEAVTTFKKEIQQLMGYYQTMLGKELRIDPDKSLRNQLFLATDVIGQMCEEKDANAVDYAANLALRSTAWDRPRNKEWYRECVELDFEHTKIKAPVGYIDYLKNEYGESYMIPIRFSSAHGYPFFREEIQVLIGGDSGEIFNFNNSDQFFLDTMDSFWQAHGQLCQYTGASDDIFIPDESMYNPEAALGMLGELQENAVSFGEALEGILEENNDAVPYLEKYCECIYELYNMIVDDADKTRLYFKIVVAGEFINGAFHSIYKERNKKICDSVPLYLEKRMTRPDGSRKKGIVYGLSATDIINNGSISLVRIREYLEQTRMDERFVFLFVPKATVNFMEKCHLSLHDAYVKLIEEIKTMDHVMLCDEPTQTDIVRAMCLSEEYYGDQCRLFDAAKMAGLLITRQVYQPV